MRFLPYQPSYRACTQESGLSAWQPDALQALGTPMDAVRSGRGTRMEWSRRKWTTMKSCPGMWQETQSTPALGFPRHSLLWKVWVAAS